MMRLPDFLCPVRKGCCPCALISYSRSENSNPIVESTYPYLVVAAPSKMTAKK